MAVKFKTAFWTWQKSAAISILVETIGLLLGKPGSEWQNNLCAMIELQPPLPVKKGFLVKV